MPVKCKHVCGEQARHASVLFAGLVHIILVALRLLEPFVLLLKQFARLLFL